MIKLKRGLEIPISGKPRQEISPAPTARSVAVVGFDHVGMKPTMEVQVGDRVKLGQLLFTDKKTEGVRYTAPACGTVSAINRGARRVLQSVVIEVADSENAPDDYESFPTFSADAARDLEAKTIREQLIQSGQWTALRTRPFSKVPALDARCMPPRSAIEWRSISCA